MQYYRKNLDNVDFKKSWKLTLCVDYKVILLKKTFKENKTRLMEHNKESRNRCTDL